MGRGCANMNKMAYNGSTTTTTTIEQLPTSKSSTNKVNKTLNGDSGNDSLITTRGGSQDSAIVDDLDGEIDRISGASSITGCGGGAGVPDGDVNSIFLCEFHAVEGPKITLQVPNDHVTKDLFRIVHQYIIPKVPLQGSFLSM